MKIIITSCIVLLAIGTGIAVGYGTVKVSSAAYGTAASYVAEVRTNLVAKTPVVQGGPESTPSTFTANSLGGVEMSGTFEISADAVLPRVSSESFLVADLKSGKILASKNINQQRSIASITKLMTSIVADETLGLDHKTVITQRAIDTYGTQGDLRTGETYSVSELLYPVLLESSNDAAEALALAQDRPAFIKAMNDKAKTLGLTNTQYDDASGLSQYNLSTVIDLFKLTQYIHSYRGYIFDLTTVQKIELGNKSWYSNSRFRNDREYVGGKNGYTTAANKTQIALFEEKFEGDTRVVAYIILGSDDIGYDINMLRNYVYKNVELVKI